MNIWIVCILSLLHDSICTCRNLIDQDTPSWLGVENFADTVLAGEFWAVRSLVRWQSSIGLEHSVPTLGTVPIRLSIVHFYVSLIEAVAQVLENLLLLCSSQIWAFIDVIFRTHWREAVKDVEYWVFNIYLTVATLSSLPGSLMLLIIYDGGLFTENIPESWCWSRTSVHRNLVVGLDSLLVCGSIDTGK